MPGLAIGPFGLGPFELILILAIVIIIFGVGKLPEIGGAVGKGIREFRRSAKEEPEEAKQISESTSTAEVPPAAPPESPPIQPVSVTCAKCGTANAPANKFCSSCGASLEARVE